MTGGEKVSFKSSLLKRLCIFFSVSFSTDLDSGILQAISQHLNAKLKHKLLWLAPRYIFPMQLSVIIGNVLNGVENYGGVWWTLVAATGIKCGNLQEWNPLKEFPSFTSSHTHHVGVHEPHFFWGKSVQTITRCPKNVNIQEPLPGSFISHPFFFNRPQFGSLSPALYQTKSVGKQCARIRGAADRSARIGKCWSFSTANASNHPQ